MWTRTPLPFTRDLTAECLCILSVRPAIRQQSGNNLDSLAQHADSAATSFVDMARPASGEVLTKYSIAAEKGSNESARISYILAVYYYNVKFLRATCLSTTVQTTTGPGGQQALHLTPRLRQCPGCFCSTSVS